MPNQNEIKRPSYAIASVDHALQLIQMLRDSGRIRVSTAAAELGVAASTVHRLLAMLVYRGFAIRDDDRAYSPGPALGAAPMIAPWSKTARDVCHPYLELLSDQLGETVNLLIRVGSKVRFLDTVESSAVLRIGDRKGTILDARHSSGGKALLAEASPETLERLYQSKAAAVVGEVLSEAEYRKLLRQLDRVIRDGYALNLEETEVGVCAIGLSLHSRTGDAIAAFSVSVPVSRSALLRDAQTILLLNEARAQMEGAIADAAI